MVTSQFPFGLKILLGHFTLLIGLLNSRRLKAFTISLWSSCVNTEYHSLQSLTFHRFDKSCNPVLCFCQKLIESLDALDSIGFLRADFMCQEVIMRHSSHCTGIDQGCFTHSYEFLIQPLPCYREMNSAQLKNFNFLEFFVQDILV